MWCVEYLCGVICVLCVWFVLNMCVFVCGVCDCVFVGHVFLCGVLSILFVWYVCICVGHVRLCDVCWVCMYLHSV